MSTPGPARLEVELEQPGRHFGSLFVPHSHDFSAYGRISLPVITLIGGSGPTLLCVGGVHGDEYEGQIALADLARRLDPARLAGRLIIVPVANPPASQAARRTSPIDGGNLARCFPGRADASLTEQIAEGINRLLLPLADCVLDIHSGGRTLNYLPCSFGRLPAQKTLARKTLDLMLAFGAPHTLFVLRPEASGTLVSAALGLGIPAMATELGGGGGVSPQTLGIARWGLDNVLAFMGMAAPPQTTPTSTRLMGIEPGYFLRAPGSGLFEPRHELGDCVSAGDEAGRLWCMERPEREPELLTMPTDGLLVCRRVPSICAQADVLLHLARDIEPGDLIDPSKHCGRETRGSRPHLPKCADQV